MATTRQGGESVSRASRSIPQRSAGNRSIPQRNPASLALALALAFAPALAIASAGGIWHNQRSYARDHAGAKRAESPRIR